MILRELLTKFGLDFQKGDFDRADAAVNALKGAAVKLAGVFVSWKAVDALRSTIDHTTDLGDKIDEASQRLGITSDAFQELAYAARFSGVEMGEMESGLSFLARKSGEAAAGNKDAAQSFANLGIAIRGNDGKLKSADELMNNVADSMAKAKTQNERLQIAFDMFGRGAGHKMALVLKDGSKALAAARKEAHDLGAVMSKDMIAKSAEFRDQLDRVSTVTQGWKNLLVEGLLPAITPLVDGLVEWAKANRAVIKEKIADFADRLSTAIKVAAPVIVEAAKALGKFVGWLIDLDDRTGILKIVVIAMNAMEIATIALVAAIGLLGEEIDASFDDDKLGMFERFSGKWQEVSDAFLQPVEGEPGIVTAAKFLISVLADVFALIDTVLTTLENHFLAVFDFIDSIVQQVQLLPFRVKAAIKDMGIAFDSFLTDHPIIAKVAHVANAPGRAVVEGAEGGARALGLTPSSITPSVAARSGTTVVSSPRIEVNVEANGQQLDNASLAHQIKAAVADAHDAVNRATLQALTPQAVTP